MPRRKGMRNIFSNHSSHHSTTSLSPSSTSPSVSSHSSPLRHHTTFSESLVEENVEVAEAIIKKWNIEASTVNKVSYLFADDDGGDRKEAKQFVKSIKDLQAAMHYYVSEISSSSSYSAKLISAQNLMEMAMKRIEKEFYQILSTNRDNLDPESISRRSYSSSHASTDISRTPSTSDFENEISEGEGQGQGQEEDQDEDDDEDAAAAAAAILVVEGEQVSSLAMSDLRLIAECMISAGYGKECVRIYNIIRKSIVDEGLYRLGVEQRITPNQINKMEWETLDFKIRNWVNAVKVAVKTLFSGERILCDYVFSTSDSIRESCFTEITREGATSLLSFPEIVVAKRKKSPEKMFRILDLYDAISELWPEIEFIFSFESTTTVRSHAVTSLIKLGDAIRSMLTDFEAAIQKDSSKSPVPGGGVHPLTRYVMNYICFLSDYSGILSDITAELPLPDPTSLPDSLCDNSEEEFSTSAIAVRFAWLVLVLLCKLDGKTELFKDVSLSYLFLANNLNYVISKVRGSNLKFLLGQDWIAKHELKVRQYSSNYERMGWSKVLSALPDDPTAEISTDEAKLHFRTFSSAFETAYRTQSSWVVSDAKLRDQIKLSLSNKITPTYREFYYRNSDAARQDRNFESLLSFTPDDLGNYLSDLFYGNAISGSSTRGSHSS